MAKMRRTSEQALDLKIEQAQERVARTRAAHEKAVDDLKKLLDIRKAQQKDQILKAMESSSRSFDEIMAFITGESTDAEEETE